MHGSGRLGLRRTDAGDDDLPTLTAPASCGTAVSWAHAGATRAVDASRPAIKLDDRRTILSPLPQRIYARLTVLSSQNGLLPSAAPVSTGCHAIRHVDLRRRAAGLSARRHRLRRCGFGDEA